MKRSAFTLIELLVVISIISLLSSVVLSSLSTARAKARDARRMSDLRQINTALQMYISDKGRAPLNRARDNHESEWITFASELQPYMKTLPKDPCPTCSPYNGITNDDGENLRYVYESGWRWIDERGLEGITTADYQLFPNALETRPLNNFGFSTFNY